MRKNKSSFEIEDKGTYLATITKVKKQFENGLAIFTAKVPAVTEPIEVIGNVSNILKVNSQVVITGRIKKDKNYGVQFSASEIKVQSSGEELAVLKFLSDGNVYGFSGMKGPRVVNKYGIEISKVFKDEKIVGEFCTGETIRKAMKSFENSEHLLPIYRETNGGISKRGAEKIYDEFGKDSAIRIKRNPYCICDVSGYGFAAADKIALNSGMHVDSPSRISAAIDRVFDVKKKEDGDCYVAEETLIEEVKNLIYAPSSLMHCFYSEILGYKTIPSDKSEWEVTSLCDIVRNRPQKFTNMLKKWEDLTYRNRVSKEEDFSFEETDTFDVFFNKRNELEEQAKKILDETSIDISNLSPEEALTIIELRNTEAKYVKMKGGRKETAYQKVELFKTECNIARLLVENSKRRPEYSITDDVISRVIGSIENSNGIKFDEDQKNAVIKTLNNRVSIITGGPGRGKTTIIQAIINAWTSEGCGQKSNVILLAPTGRAARRMKETIKGDFESSTICKELSRMKQKKIKRDTKRSLVIIDESSMIDIDLMERVTYTFSDSHVCYVGDVDQLPSVGAGNVLDDLIRSNAIACSRLVTCHRNAGSILNNSLIINTGGFIKQLETNSNFKTIWTNKDNENEICDKIFKLYPACIQKYGISEVIVLAAMRNRGKNCVNTLNKKLKEIANPLCDDKKEIIFDSVNGEGFREGDRVVHTANDYDRECEENGEVTLGVFNGETGTIDVIDPQNEMVSVVFDDGKRSYYTFDDARSKLSLNFATTYHKSQGSEYACVFCVLSTSDYVLLQRKILYTGESRAKKMCIFIGHAYAFQLAMNNASVEDGRRRTMLAARISQYANIM